MTVGSLGRSGLVASFVALAVLAGCDGAERRDAASVVTAVARFRSADNASTPAMVEALKATPCTADRKSTRLNSSH